MSYPKFSTMMSELIATPSVSSVSPEWDQSNSGVVDQLASWCQDAGFNIEIMDVPNCPGKTNLIANYGSGPDGLVLSGHTDTVPFDAGKWQTDPFKIIAKDNKWYGLGTCDMKGFFAVVLEALREVDLSKLTKPLTIIATADEESSMCGAKSLVEANRRLGRHAIIGEPTGLKPIRAHKGIMMESIRLTGRSGHSSNPAYGNNALEGMQRVMTDLLMWRDQLQSRYQNPMFEVDVPTINLGHIHGGDNPNRICGECELHFDLRTLPGMHMDNLREELDSRLSNLLIDSGLKFDRQPLISGTEAMDTPAASAIVQAAEKLSGHPSETVAFGTEGPYLNNLGMETVILGPGYIDQAHQPNEYLAIDQINPAITLVRDMIYKFCR